MPHGFVGPMECEFLAILIFRFSQMLDYSVANSLVEFPCSSRCCDFVLDVHCICRLIILIILSQDELATHSKPGSLSVLVYYGGDRTTEPCILSGHDVVLTTYGVLQASYKNVGPKLAFVIHLYAGPKLGLKFKSLLTNSILSSRLVIIASSIGLTGTGWCWMKHIILRTQSHKLLKLL